MTYLLRTDILMSFLVVLEVFFDVFQSHFTFPFFFFSFYYIESIHPFLSCSLSFAVLLLPYLVFAHTNAHPILYTSLLRSPFLFFKNTLPYTVRKHFILLFAFRICKCIFFL